MHIDLEVIHLGFASCSCCILLTSTEKPLLLIRPQHSWKRQSQLGGRLFREDNSSTCFMRQIATQTMDTLGFSRPQWLLSINGSRQQQSPTFSLLKRPLLFSITNFSLICSLEEINTIPISKLNSAHMVQERPNFQSPENILPPQPLEKNLFWYKYLRWHTLLRV